MPSAIRSEMQKISVASSGRPLTWSPPSDGFSRASRAAERIFPRERCTRTCSMSASATSRDSQAPSFFRICPTWPPTSA